MDEQLVPAKANQTGTPTKGQTKKAYLRPAMVYRAPLEAMAAACTGSNGKAISPGCSKLNS